MIVAKSPVVSYEPCEPGSISIAISDKLRCEQRHKARPEAGWGVVWEGFLPQPLAVWVLAPGPPCTRHGAGWGRGAGGSPRGSVGPGSWP